MAPPDDPTGTHFLPPSYRVTTGDTVQPTQHNPPFEDVSQALSNRLHKDGRTAWTGNQDANNNRITNLSNGVNPQDAVNVRQAEGQIGDFKDTVRDLSGGRWLRRDGAAYDNDDYPELSAMLPPATSASYADASFGSSNFVSVRRVTPTRLIVVGYTTGPQAAQVYTSVQGSTFNQQSVPGIVLGSLERGNGAFGNGLYAVNGRDSSLNHTIWTSPSDSGPWTKMSTFATTGANGPMAFFDGYFYVAFTPTASPPEIWRTVNGASWSKVFTATGQTQGPIDMRASDSEIVFVIGSGGSPTAYRSTDGATWSSHGLPEGVNSLAWSEHAGVWAVSATSSPTILTSNSGQTWVARDVEPVFGELGRCIVGSFSQGLLAMPTLSPFNVAAYSDNGINWYQIEGPFGDSAPRYIEQNAQSGTEFIVARSAGEITRGSMNILQDQFRVPADNHIYGWIKAKEA